MDDATQKLVSEARRAQKAVYLATDKAVADDLSRIIAGLADALEAAQRPPVSPEVRGEMVDLIESERRGWARRGSGLSSELVDVIVARFSFPSQPEVSPEAREFVAQLAGRLYHVETHRVDERVSPMPTAEVLREFDAQFSVPPQPVYDEEKIARWLHNWARVTPGTPSEFIQNLVAALVAALRGGELTREETNE